MASRLDAGEPGQHTIRLDAIAGHVNSCPDEVDRVNAYLSQVDSLAGVPARAVIERLTGSVERGGVAGHVDRSNILNAIATAQFERLRTGLVAEEDVEPLLMEIIELQGQARAELISHKNSPLRDVEPRQAAA